MVMRALLKQRHYKAPRPAWERGISVNLSKLHNNNPLAVMPAKAGIQLFAALFGVIKPWIPAFAGMTRFCKLPLNTSEHFSLPFKGRAGVGMGSNSMAYLLLLLSLWLPPLSAAQLTAALDKKISPMGEPLHLRITSAATLSELDLAPLKNNFEVFSQEASNSSRNGRAQSTLDVTLYPLRSGQLTLPSLTLGNAHTRALSVEIPPAQVSLRTLLTPSVPMEREPALLLLEIRDDGSLNWSMPTQLDAPHIALRPLPEQQREEQHDGATSIVHEYRWRVLPLKSESLSINFGMLDANKFGQRLRFPLSAVSFRVQAAPAYLPLYLPIGKPTLRTDTLPKRIFAGQPVAWTMDIQAPGLSAEGALKLLQYDTPRGLRFYPPSVTPITRDGNDALRLTLTFVAERDAQLFPALSLAYYDPQKQRIEALNIPAARIQVRDPLREKIILALFLIAGNLLLAWIGYKARPWLRRWQVKRAWLARIQAAQDAASLYRALTQQSPWQALTLQHWPDTLRIDPALRAQLEQACFAPHAGDISFADLKRAWWRACGQLPLIEFARSARNQ